MMEETECLPHSQDEEISRLHFEVLEESQRDVERPFFHLCSQQGGKKNKKIVGDWREGTFLVEHFNKITHWQELGLHNSAWNKLRQSY